MPNARKFILYMAKYYAKVGYAEGANNKNQFSDIVNAYGLNGCQNQPWCATYQFALELMAFGKEQALKNWHMDAKTYCGYSCFETEAMFAKAGATSSAPHQNDLVIFKKSHMGRVLSVSSKTKTFECAEGNSGDKCVVKTYSLSDPGIKSFCHIDYIDDNLSVEKIIGALKAAYEMAHNLKWVYADSQTIPPCVLDKRISCDRLEALACFILGYTNQPKGGFTVINMERYLTSWGWQKITSASALKAGDFILFKQNGTTTPNAHWHAFSLTKFTSVNKISKYDTGSNDRIRASQPFVDVPLNQWVGERSFYAGFRPPCNGMYEGIFEIASAVDKTFALDADKNTTNVQVWKYSGNKQQKFTLGYVDDGYYRIVCGNGKVLDVKSAKAVNKQNVQQYKWNGTKAQLWKPVKNSDKSVTFVSALNKGYVIDLSAGKAEKGQNIQLYKANDTKAQKWFLMGV